MAVREYWEIKWIKWINVQEDWVTKVSIADTVNFVGGWTVTDVAWVATINIPQWVTWYREDVTAGSATYTFQNSPATSTSFLVFTDSGTLMFSWIDYTYDPDTATITFLSLGNNESAYIWVAHAVVEWWWIGDMVKAVYDPTNINSSAFDMDNFIDGTNNHYVSTSEKGLISTALQPGDNVSELTNDAWYITSADLPTKTSDLQNDSGFITSADVPTKTSELQNDSWFITSADVPTKTSELVNDSGFWDVSWPNSSTDWNIVVFDWVTGKLIKDSGLNIQVVTTQPTGDLCSVYYDNWTIYLYTQVTPIWDYILLEDGDIILLENDDMLILE